MGKMSEAACARLAATQGSALPMLNPHPNTQSRPCALPRTMTSPNKRCCCAQLAMMMPTSMDTSKLPSTTAAMTPASHGGRQPPSGSRYTCAARNTRGSVKRFERIAKPLSQPGALRHHRTFQTAFPRLMSLSTAAGEGQLLEFAKT